MAFTREQRDALDKLPPKRRAFVLAYVGASAGNATDAARQAGYSPKVATQEGSRLLTFVDVSEAVRLLSAPAEERKYRSVEELREQWDEWAREPAFEPKDRIKASELLAKSQGGFVDRVQHEGDALAALRDLITEKRKLRKGGEDE